MKRGIVTAVLVFICFILQTSVFELIKLAGIAPNILLIFIGLNSSNERPEAGNDRWIFQWAFDGYFYGSTIGGFAFLYMMFGFVDGFFHRIYYSDDNILPLVLIGVNDLVYGVIMYILCGLLHNHLRIVYYLKNIILPEIVYTVAVGLVFYQILLRINDWLEKNEKRGADFV